jgi:hypothetical protein
MATLKDLTPFYRGETILLTYTMSPLTDITGWTLRLYVKAALSDTAVLLTVNGAITSAVAGTFSVTLTAAQTAALATGIYSYDVWRIDAGQECALAVGKMIVKGSVTLG